MTYDEAVASLARVRQKYPDYADMDDPTLASKLATKFPEYRDIHAAVNDAGAGLHGAVSTLTQNAPAEARAQAVGDIIHRQQGTALVQTGIDTSATDVSGRSLRTLEPQQVNTPQQLSSSEQLAILDAHLKDKLGVDPMNADRGQQLHQQQEQLATRQLQERFASRSMGVANTSNAALLPILKIYPNLVDLIAPGTAETYKEDLDRLLAADPESAGTKVGGVVGGAVPYMLGPAGVVAGGASAAGEFRDEVRKAREQGATIDPSQELLGAGVIIASNMAMGKFRPGAAAATVESLAQQQALKATVATALKKYALETGLAASDMMINGIAEDVVHQGTTNPEMQLGGGSVERMATGGLAHSVMGLKGTIRDVRAGMANADAVGHEGRTTDNAGSGDRGAPVGPAEGVVAEKPAAQEAIPASAEDYDTHLTKLQQEKVDADHRLQNDKTLTPEQRAELAKTSDHNAALVQNGLMEVETKFGEDASENLLTKVQGLKPTPPPKYPDRTPDSSADETFKKLMSEPSKDIRPGQEARQPEQMPVEKASKKASEIADKGVGEDVKKLLGEPPPGLPRVPRDARSWSFTKLKTWAKDAGYDVAQAENLRGLRKRISAQQHNSLTDLPELPKEAGTWNFRRLKYWAGKNGYSVETAESRQEVKDIVASSRKEDIALTRKGATAEEKAPAVQEETAKIEKAAENTRQVLQKKTGKSFIGRMYDELVKPIGSRIRDKSQRLYGRVQEMYIEGGLTSEAAKRALTDPATRIREALGGKTSKQYRQWAKHVLNGERTEATAMLPEAAKKDLDVFYDMFRSSIASQKEAGMKVGDLGENYWSRRIRDYKAFDQVFGDDQGLFEEAWNRAKAVKGRRMLTAEEKMEVANSVIEGYGPKKPGSSGPGHTRERRIEKITDEQLDHYVDPIESAFGYADASARATERAKFLGKNHDPEKMGDSVGRIVQEEVDAGHLKKVDQDEVRDLLHTLLVNDTITMSKAGRTLKQIIHVTSLGQIRSAVNQVSDIVTTDFSHGTKATAKGTAKVLNLSPGERKIYMEEMGFHSHGEEFKDVSRTAHVADEALRGFELMDRFGKEGRANAAFTSFSDAAKHPDSAKFRALKEKWEPVLGADAFAEVASDLKEGKRSRSVFKLLALDVAEIQPVTPANMPAQYLKMKDGRLLYSLKSYTLTHLDFMRREMFSKLATPGKRLEGIKALGKFTLVLAMFNFGKDLITDLIRGKELDPDQVPERAVDSLLSVVGLNRFTGEKLATEPGKAITELGAPPLNWADALVHDVSGAKGGLKTLKYVPIIGEPLYYRTPIGHGYQMQKKEQQARANKRIYGTH